MTIYVQMDNSAAVEHYRDSPDSEDIKARPLTGERIFEISFPEGTEEEPVTLREMIMTTMATYRHHQEAGNTEGHALVRPRWVRSNDARLEAELVSEYHIARNDIPTGFGSEHDSWDRLAMPSLRTIAQSTTLLSLSLTLLAAWSLFKLTRLNLRTTAGRDWQANLMGNPSNNGTGVYAAAAWIGVTADATVPTLGDVLLPGEVISGTLVRAQGAFGHTTGAASYTVSKLFVSDQSIIIPKIGIFNSATGGAPFIETMLSAVAVLNSGDQLQIVSTVTL
jgi:hypothetical protein